MPRTITGDIRELILKVREFFILEKKNKGPIIPYHKIRERVAAATGVSQHTVTNIVKEGIVAQATGTKIPTPGQHRKTRKDKVVLDENDLSTIKRKIQEYVTEKNERPSVKKLHQRLKEEADIKFSREILRQYMKKISGDVSQTSSDKKDGPPAPSDRTPNSNSSKNAMMEWLTRHSIDFSPEYSKLQLMELVRAHRAKKPKKVDAILAGISNSGCGGETSIQAPKPPTHRFPIKQDSANKPIAADFKESPYVKHMGLLDSFQRSDGLPVPWEKMCGVYHKESIYAGFGDGRTEAMVPNFKRDP